MPPLWQFSLSEMMALVTLVAICLSIWVISFELSILAITVFVPALIRTLVANRIARSKGIIFSAGRPLAEIAYSIVCVLVGYVLFLAVFAAIALPLLIVVVFSARFFEPHITFYTVAVLFWVAVLATAVLYIYVQWRFLRSTLR